MPADQPLSLSNETAQNVGDLIRLRDADLRREIGRKVFDIFRWSNGATLVAIGGLAALDQYNAVYKVIANADQRLISEKVVMALLGATTIQTGTIAVIIARYLFPGQSSDTKIK